jgi:hypothetical protein
VTLRVDIAGLRTRQETYLPSHYLSVHITAVGVALGVAGLSAASLIGPDPQHHANRTLFWVLFVVGLMATAAAYAGTMVGAILLPPRLPGVTDLLLPLLLALSEFLLFGILAYQVTGLSLPTAIMYWWYALSLFGLATAGNVRRADWLLNQQHYQGSARCVIARYRMRLRTDIRATTGMFAGGALIGSGQLAWDPRMTGHLFGVSAVHINAYLGLAAGGLLLTALIGHGGTARQLRKDLADPPLCQGSEGDEDDVHGCIGVPPAQVGLGRRLLRRIHNPRDRHCGCEPGCWCRRTSLGRTFRWWFPARLFGLRHRGSGTSQ